MGGKPRAERGRAFVKKTLEIAWHRNGVTGKGFYAVRFLAECWAGTLQKVEAEFLAILTDDKTECYVICLDMLGTEGVGDNNKWRGDVFENDLRRAIESWERQQDDKFKKRL